MFLCEHRVACGDAPDHRDAVGFRQPDAPGSAGNNFDCALARQCLEVFLRRIGRTKTQFPRNVGAGGRETGLIDVPADQVEDLLLAVGQLFHHNPCFYIQML